MIQIYMSKKFMRAHIIEKITVSHIKLKATKALVRIT